MSKIPKPKVLLGTVILVAALVALAVVPVMAQIPVFSAFMGDVLLDGANAPAGATVDVYVGTEATPRATVTLTTAGSYEVNVQGQATDVGQAVSFKVNGLAATTTPASPLFGNYTTQTVDLAASSGPVTTCTLTIVVSPSGGGTTNPAVGTHQYAAGTVVNLTATEATGYNFSQWSGDASGYSPTTTVTMDANKSVTANFVLEAVGDYPVLAWWMDTL